MNFGLFWRIHLLLLLLCRDWHSERIDRILTRMWNYLLKIDVRQSKHQYGALYYSQKNPLLLSSFLPLKCCCSCHCDPFTPITFVKHSTSPPKDFWNSKCQKNIPFLGVSGSQKAAITQRSPPGWRIGIRSLLSRWKTYPLVDLHLKKGYKYLWQKQNTKNACFETLNTRKAMRFSQATPYQIHLCLTWL